VHLDAVAWTPESLLTPSFKLKRTDAKKMYQKQVRCGVRALVRMRGAGVLSVPLSAWAPPSTRRPCFVDHVARPLLCWPLSSRPPRLRSSTECTRGLTPSQGEPTSSRAPCRAREARAVNAFHGTRVCAGATPGAHVYRVELGTRSTSPRATVRDQTSGSYTGPHHEITH